MSQDTTQKVAQATDKNSQSTRQSPSNSNARLESLLKELDRPLENVDWSKEPEPGDEEGKNRFVQRVRRHRSYRRELKRARRAAASVYQSKPRRSARKRASLMMGAGALSLGAFTQPPTQANSLTAPIMASLEPAEEVRKHASELSASEEFKQALIEEEGVRHRVYRDVAGYPTVGVGHLVLPEDNLRVGDRISKARADALLDQDLAKAAEGVVQLVGDLPLYQHEFDALLDLVFNVGIGNVSAEKSPRLNEAIDAGDYEGISQELDYRHAAGKVARGLEYRSKRRARIFMEASYENPRKVDKG